MEKLILLLTLFLCQINPTLASPEDIERLEQQFNKIGFLPKNHEEVVSICSKLLEHVPNHALAHFRKGRSHEFLHQIEQAIHHYQLALQYGYVELTKDSMIYLLLASCLHSIGKSEEALEACRKGMKAGFHHRSIYNMEAEILMKLGRFGELKYQ